MKLIPKYKIGAKIRKAQSGMEALTARDRLMLAANWDSSNLTATVPEDMSFSTQKKSDQARYRNYWLKEANKTMKLIFDVDNYFKSIEDVITAQKELGVTADGKIGKNTFNALIKLKNNKGVKDALKELKLEVEPKLEKIYKDVPNTYGVTKPSIDPSMYIRDNLNRRERDYISRINIPLFPDEYNTFTLSYRIF